MGYISELRELIGSRPIIMVGANVIVVNSENQSSGTSNYP